MTNLVTSRCELRRRKHAQTDRQTDSGELKGEIPAERQSTAEVIVALLHSHALVKGYSGRQRRRRRPLHPASTC